jgi:hypothetical protein
MMIGNCFPLVQVNWGFKLNQVVVDTIVDAFLYAFDLVDGEIHVNFDQSVIVVE